LKEATVQPGNYSIEVPGNSTFALAITWTDSTGAVVNLTGYSAAMQVKRQNGAAVILLSTGNGLIAVAATAPNLSLSVPIATMETLICPDGKYDLVVRSPGGVQTTLLQGPFTVSPWITP
jgi:hypothetical protein